MSVKQHRDNTIIPYIIEVMCLRLKEKEALSYLEDRGFKISHDFYYRLRKEVQESTHTRLNLMGGDAFTAQHLARLDSLKTIENELWTQYHAEQNPTKKSNILMQLAEMQQLLAVFHDSTRWVLEQGAKQRQQEQKKVNEH